MPKRNAAKRISEASKHKGNNTGNPEHTSIRGIECHNTNSKIDTPSDTLPFDLKQALLDVFKNAFFSQFSGDLHSVIQEVKHHLYNRDFADAFGQQAFLEAYVMRWSASRALAYADIFHGHSPLSAIFSDHLRGRESVKSSTDKLGSLTGPKSPSESICANSQTTKVVCLGGGAGAEIAAIAAFLSYLCRPTTSEDDPNNAHLKASLPSFKLTAVDVANWHTVVEKLHDVIANGPLNPSDTSPRSSMAGKSLTNTRFLSLEFKQYDVLNIDISELGHLFRSCRLVTVMFTLNELYSTSMSATTKLLLSMTTLLEPGSLLLVVDSPGSYSTVNVGQPSKSEKESRQKKYPMQWLLDHTLLEAAQVTIGKQNEAKEQWEKLEECPSRWFRLPPGLKYPIFLEDMRYQLHLYRRLA